MRIERLDLLRFGHFADVSIALPLAPRDFQVIVGPNEAGKSTVRSAILDLLFGMSSRCTYDWLYPKAELRIGAAIRHGDKVLEFCRVKKAKSLTDPAGASLSNDALGAFLGGVNRDSYTKMFGLDHERLVAGGKELLDHGDDVGGILFQSATGLVNLGNVREGLEAEADKLWAKRKSGEREYYKALAVLEAAEAELKRTSVKGKDWLEARDNVSSIERELHELNSQYGALEGERIRLERTRRVARFLRDHAEAAAALASLGEPVVLPADAAAHLSEAEAAMATADTLGGQAARNLEAARAARAAIATDEETLRHAQEIEALAKRQQQTEHHERDIAKREAEVATHWGTVLDAVRQLGWPASDEAALRARLPSLPARRTLTNLIKKHSALEQAVSAAAEAENARRTEVSDNERELAQQAAVEVSAELRAALDSAGKLGDSDASARREATKLAKLRRELAAAETALGPWRLEPDQLRALVLPAAEVVRTLRAEQDRLQQDLRVAADKHDALMREIASAELSIEQYRQSHRAVTMQELTASRGLRDSTWAGIKAGKVSVAEAAPEYERQVRDSDELADQRHDRASEAAELQLRLNGLGQLRQQLASEQARDAKLASELAESQARWTVHATRLGFADMPLLAYEEWRGARDKVMSAAEAVDLADSEAQQQKELVELASGTLRVALGAAGRAVAAEARLDVLVSEAKSLVEASVQSKARIEELTRQIATGKRALAELADKHERARSELEDWNTSWQEATARAGLSGWDIGAVEGALTLFEDIDGRLKSIQDVRENRIQTMRRDLDELAFQARVLAEALGAELAVRPAAEVSRALSTRLAVALQQKREAEQLESEVRKYAAQVDDAAVKTQEAKGRIAPLMQAAATSEVAALREAIGRSDAWRALRSELDKARESAESHGDGLTLAQLGQEADGADLALSPARVSEIARLQEELRTRQATLSANLATARAQLERIAGQDDAARAAAMRQEGLARMADAAERYIKVRVGERLLGWAIERYRESKQEPMLKRASELFAGLTLGSFERLTVEFELTPPKLAGVRPDRRVVDTDRMSDGTRDQLYLALRLAALELQVDEAHAMPFIADDLFVNFDDARARAGLEALARLSERTQVLFLTHHTHLLAAVREVFGEGVGITELGT